MTEKVVIENVTLRGDDLNIVWSAWRRMNRANNLRLIPIVVGFLGSCFAISFLIDPRPTEVFAVFAPLLLGWMGFIWVTNGVYVTAYKKRILPPPSAPNRARSLSTVTECIKPCRAARRRFVGPPS